MKSYYKLLFAGLLFFTAAACENETEVCDQTLRTDLRIRFAHDSAGIVRDTIMPKVTVFAIGRDSIYKRQPLGSIFLQLSPLADESRYHLKVDSALVADTLTFRYKRKANFVSPGCGFTTFFSIDTLIATRNTIDSVQINKKEVTTGNDTHYTLYFFNE